MKSRLLPHKEAIREALENGASHRNLAKTYGVAKGTMTEFIANHLRDVQRPLRSVTAAPTDEVTQLELVTAERDELRSALRKQRKVVVADERLMQTMISAAASVPPRPLPRQDLMPKRAPGDAHHRGVLLLSDFHGGERVDPQVVNGLNEYDWEIQEARVEELLVAVEKHLAKSPALTGLDVGFLGDMCSGANHEEIKETNQYVMAEQGVRMAYLKADIVGQLADQVPDIRVFEVEGNHPRFEKKPAAKNPHNNMDWVAAEFTRAMVSPRLANLSDYQVGRGSLFWEVAGRRAYVFHGDGIRSSMPGVPWGGVARRCNSLQATYPFQIDHFWCGHFHQANVTEAGRIAMNGSLKGVDEWCLKNFGSGGPPCQLLLLFDERAERMTDVKYITPTAGL